MEKGFRERTVAVLAAAWLLAGLAAGPAPASLPSGKGPAGLAESWEVRLDISAEGGYSVRGGGAPVAGEYACRARWEGRLEQDGDDFLLVHLRSEILDWRLRERSGPAGREDVIEAPAGVRPELRMCYVLRDGGEAEFVFELGGVTIPLHASPLNIPLDLPRASGQPPGEPGQRYGDFVCRGSSRVAIPETDLQGRSRRHFSWDWRRERRPLKGGVEFAVTQSHTVKVVVAVVAR